MPLITPCKQTVALAVQRQRLPQAFFVSTKLRDPFCNCKNSDVESIRHTVLRPGHFSTGLVQPREFLEDSDMDARRTCMAESPDSTSKASKLISQVNAFVLDAISSGTFRKFDQLPSERELAERLGISRSTVTAAYADMEQRGFIRRLHGKGAFVRPTPVETGSSSWSGKIARSANELEEPVLELLARRCADGMLYPLSAGTPSLEIFPAEAYRESAQRVMSEHVPSCLTVAPTEGQWILRQAIGRWIDVPAPNVMVVAGAQEGIDLIARCLVEPGDAIVVDAPTYPGATQSFRSAGAKLLPWSTDWSLSQLEDLFLRFRPKLLFTMPTFHNPTGRTMSLKTRVGLLDLAGRYQVSVIEDDVYSRSVFASGGTPDSLYQLATHSDVISVSTFSKLLAPGLRIGWITAPLYMVKQLSLIKMRSNLFTAGLTQMILADMLSTGTFEKHLLKLREHHGELCEIAVAALKPAVDAGLLKYRVPAGSLYLWCKCTKPVNMDRFYEDLESHGVSVAPGIAFRPEAGQEPDLHFRICFTATTGRKLAEGLGLLCRALARACDKPVGRRKHQTNGETQHAVVKGAEERMSAGAGGESC